MDGRGIVRKLSVGSLLAAAVVPACAHGQAPEFVLPEPTRSAEEIRAYASDFTFARVAYTDNAPPFGQIVSLDSGPVVQPTGSWQIDYPEADRAFSEQVAEHLGLSVDPEGVIVSLTDPGLSQYPMIYLVEGGHLSLTDDEVPALRNYLLRGGFLMIDDFWGADEWVSLATELARVFPDRPIVELPAEHDVFHAYYSLAPPAAIPGMAQVRAGDYSDEPRYRGIHGDDGRLLVILLYNLDLGDAWEHVDDPGYPGEYSRGAAVPLGINILAYALTH